MGAKNSKARKKGVAGEDESQDAVDKTATLPASFKQKVGYHSHVKIDLTINNI